MTKTRTLPAWLLERERYSPPADRDAFVDRTIKAFLSVLAAVRLAGGNEDEGAGPAVKVASAFLLVLLLSLSRNIVFVAFAGTYLLVVLSLQPGERLARVLKTGAAAAAFAFAVLAPSALLGNQAAVVMITAKVFVSVSCVKLLSATTKWSSLTGSLKAFRVPDLFIFVLDIALKYVVLLSELSLKMLFALKLRSVGRNRRKAESLSGIAGTLFLKSQEQAQDLEGAMKCRGFTGEYRLHRKSGVSAANCVAVGIDLLTLISFILLGA